MIINGISTHPPRSQLALNDYGEQKPHDLNGGGCGLTAASAALAAGVRAAHQSCLCRYHHDQQQEDMRDIELDDCGSSSSSGSSGGSNSVEDKYVAGPATPPFFAGPWLSSSSQYHHLVPKLPSQHIIRPWAKEPIDQYRETSAEQVPGYCSLLAQQQSQQPLPVQHFRGQSLHLQLLPEQANLLVKMESAHYLGYVGEGSDEGCLVSAAGSPPIIPIRSLPCSPMRRFLDSHPFT